MSPDYIFEVSWEVANKIGGIHTVISTKAPILAAEQKDNYICIGPDVWKEAHRNPEFEEDTELFRAWREYAAKQNIHVRIGRWQVPGNPIAFLVDFTPLFGKKDDIFSDYWLKFGLNSLSGQWDYTEPAMFGYAAGQVIESFYDFHMTAHDKLIAHFHEWMTGSGVLYLRDRVPQAGTIFTTHATVVGRAIAGHGQDLYQQLERLDAEAKANELGVLSKYSLEKVAAGNADAFTTVSESTANECEHVIGKRPHVVTPNGIGQEMLIPDAELGEKRKAARSRLLTVARGLLQQNLPEDSFLIGHSGRYEFRNKGIDIFIDALGKLNKTELEKPMVAFIMVPGHQTGFRKELPARIENPDFDHPFSEEHLTHRLAGPDHDTIMQRLRQAGLLNLPEDKVKVIFTPAYLNGNDGIYQMTYFDLLPGFDATAFPSYYEPWGYTPMESIVMQVPTISANLSGFGIWVVSKPDLASDEALKLITRGDQEGEQPVADMTDIMTNWIAGAAKEGFSKAKDLHDPVCHKNMIPARKQAKDIALTVVWDQQMDAYREAFDLALETAGERYHQYKDKKQPIRSVAMPPIESMRPKWKRISIGISMPEELKTLPEIAKNLWWTWNDDARRLFQRIEPDVWESTNKNPVELLDQLSMEDYDRLKQDKKFMERYHRVEKKFQDYMEAGNHKKTKQIAYFSMEYGLNENVKIYSGGLGVLAGDFLKQASDDNVDMVGIGLLYRYGYFTQSLSLHGEQLDTYHPHDFASMFAKPVRDKDGKRVKISIGFPGRTLHARVWRIDVGRVPLYLLDTDISENQSVDRFVTHQLYGGDWENRFKQEFLLGIGGIRMLDAIGLQPEVYHCNEGHAAFTGLERLRKYVEDEKLSFHEAQEAVRASSLFTTHTPVPAGHDFFSEDMLRTYMPHYADRLGISWETFMGLGKMNPQNPEEDYSMSVLAAKLARHVNGVSLIHGKVARDMFRDLYPGYFPEEIHIGHVTNGVHYGSWTAGDWQELYRNTFGNEFIEDISSAKKWEKIYDVPDKQIWDLRSKNRKNLLKYIENRLLQNLSRRQETPRKIYQLMEAVNEDALTIGFARRFATYKRAHLLFNDLERLSRIVNDPERPVQFIYAGKAHPADKAGQELIKHILEVSRRKEFRGKIIFLEDYDMELGRELVKGVDIWLNTPTRPQEASGTSGQKAALNGVMNFSVLDGWWAEGYTEEAGWQLKEEKTFENQEFQNELDAETIYNTLETEITPMFYDQNEKGIPAEWVRWIKNNIARIAPHYTNKRMMDDYFEQYYNELFQSSERFRQDDFKLARAMVYWKNKVLRAWDTIQVVDKKLLSNSGKELKLGDLFLAELTLEVNDIKDSDFGVEVVFSRKSPGGDREMVSVYEMEKVKSKGSQVTFKCEVPAQRTGDFNYAFRVFPKHPELAHRQDFNLIKWI